MAYPTKGFMNRFARHPVAANLLMILMLLGGFWALVKLNVQYLPTFELNFVTTSVIWPAASPDDIERSVIDPLETELRNCDDIKEMNSTAREGFGSVVIEFKQGADMTHALDQVKEKVALIKNLPEDSEEPIIQRFINFEPIAKLLISGNNRQELRRLAHNYERQLLSRGIAKIDFLGMPEQEIAIQVPTTKLAELNVSLDQIANRIRQLSQDIPAGTIGRSDVGSQLRSLNQLRDVRSFFDLPLYTDKTGRLLTLGDIATIEKRPRENEVTITYEGKPAIQLSLLRSEKANALESAQIFEDWLNKIQNQLPQGIKLHVFDQRWKLIKQRINILIKNGTGGFFLIITILFILLNRRIAFWVAMGIPVSMAAAFAVLYAAGGSINMISLFAFIMTLGIIVDDTIVVSEETLTQLNSGKPILAAINIATQKMLAPILASSLTTIAAFLPLMIISDIIGTVLKQIPLVVICVIIASLIECFLVLPGHLHHSLKKLPANSQTKNPLRIRIDTAFDHFKNNQFRRLVSYVIKNPWLGISYAAALFVFSIGLVAGNRVHFTFFPSPDMPTINANIEFAAGTSDDKMDSFLKEIQRALITTDKELSPQDSSLILTTLRVDNKASAERFEQGVTGGRELASISVELLQPDSRDVTNKQFITAWRKKIHVPPSVNNFTITSPRVGPPGKDIDVSISGSNWQSIKIAAKDVKTKLREYAGLSDIKDDLPYGQQEFIFDLSVEGKALGLTTQSVGRQLRAAFSGEIVQVFHQEGDEIEVRVMLPDNERDQYSTLESLPIVTLTGTVVPLYNVVDFRYRRGLNVLKHTNTELTTHVTAEVDSNVANANQITDDLQKSIISKIIRDYGVTVNFKGRAEEQETTLSDMKLGLIIALSLIYIILAWVFASYVLPLLIMLAIPLGLTGAILGHWILGIDLTILSLFGFFGLSGIVINDSIILVNRYIDLREKFDDHKEAIIETSCQRLRAVLLTSLTTIAGLTPLLFETSLQAQFLIPMAVSIAFGLMFSTVLVLIIVPCLLMLYEQVG